MNFWIRILEWFHNVQERHSLILGFNDSAKNAFTEGYMPLILEAKMSRGNPNNRHSFSNRLYSGFRIKAHSGSQLSKSDIVHIGEVILGDRTLVRKLVILGFDTLEVHCDVGNYGCQWRLQEYMQIGNINGNNYGKQEH